MIRYETSLAAVRAADLAGFFVGWPETPSTERHLEALRGSECVVLARDDQTGRVVGFVSVVGDGALSAFVPLLEVLPEYQGRGIGTELVRHALELVGDRYAIDLSCDDELVPFYERFGMERITGMALRNPGALAC